MGTEGNILKNKEAIKTVASRRILTVVSYASKIKNKINFAENFVFQEAEAIVFSASVIKGNLVVEKIYYDI